MGQTMTEDVPLSSILSDDDIDRIARAVRVGPLPGLGEGGVDTSVIGSARLIVPEPRPAATTAQKALTIHPKSASSGLGGAAALVVLYCLRSIWGIEPEPEVAAAITVVVGFICSYFAPKAPTTL